MPLSFFLRKLKLPLTTTSVQKVLESLAIIQTVYMVKLTINEETFDNT